jgi:hypothetical protein
LKEIAGFQRFFAAETFETFLGLLAFSLKFGNRSWSRLNGSRLSL